MNRHKIYRCLENGESMGAKQIAAATGLTLHVVQETLGAMRDYGFVKTSPVLYTLSNEGSTQADKVKRAREAKAAKVQAQEACLAAAKSGQVANSVFNWRQG